MEIKVHENWSKKDICLYKHNLAIFLKTGFHTFFFVGGGGPENSDFEITKNSANKFVVSKIPVALYIW